MERTNWGKIIWAAVLPVIITTLVSLLFTWVSLPAGKVTIGKSVKDGNSYITTVSIKNFNSSKSLEEIEIYLNHAVNVTHVVSNTGDSFNAVSNVFTVNHFPPNQTETYIFYSSNEIHPEDMNIGTDLKMQVTYLAEEKNITGTLLLMIAFYILFFGGMTFFTILRDDKKRKDAIISLKKDQEEITNSMQELKNTLSKTQDERDEVKKTLDDHVSEHRKNMLELRIYYLARMKDYQKELSFWRDTIRKFLYQSGKSEDCAEKLIENATDILATYGTRKTADNNYNEINYLAHRLRDDLQGQNIDT